MTMKKIVYIIVAILLFAGVPAKCADDIKQEAARFAKESEFLRSQGRYELALEKAETALVLDPENENIHQNLAIALVSQACDLFPQSNASPRNLLASLQDVRLALAYAVRVQDIVETLPRNMRHVVDRGYLHDMQHLRKHLLEYATEKYPELKNEVEQLNKRHLDFWMEHTYRPYIATERISRVDYELFSSNGFYSCVHTGCYNIFTSQTDADVVHCYEEMVNDLLAGEIRRTGCSILIPCITFLTGRQKYLPLEKKDAQVSAALERIAKALEDDPRPMFRHYGWIVRHNDGWYIGGPHNKKQDARNYFNRLRDHIAGLPRDESSKDVGILYESLYNVIRYCHGSNEPIQRFALWLEIFRLADAREDTLDSIVFYAIHDFPRETDMKISDELHRDFADHAKLLEQHIAGIRQNMPEYVRLFERHIERLESLSPKKASIYRNDLAAKRWDVPKRNTLLPWGEEILLVNGISTFIRPIVWRNKVYYIKAPYGLNRVFVNSIDLVTDEKTTSDPLPGQHPNHGYLCVDDANVYFGGSHYFAEQKHGVFVFPIDGSAPWALGPEEGLPSIYVQAMATFHGKLYLGVGSKDQTTWLVRVDPKTREVEILASSSGREGKAPFFNISPSPQYQFLLEDPIRDRLLLIVSIGTGVTGGTELWAMDGKTEQFAKLLRTSGYGSMTGDFMPDGKQLLLYTNILKTLLVNLEESNAPAPIFMSVYDQYKPIISGLTVDSGHGCIFRDWVWGKIRLEGSGLMWGRIALDGKSPFEPLPLPEAVKSSHIGWLYCLPTSDGNGLLVGDSDKLVLLRFE